MLTSLNRLRWRFRSQELYLCRSTAFLSMAEKSHAQGPVLLELQERSHRRTAFLSPPSRFLREGKKDSFTHNASSWFPVWTAGGAVRKPFLACFSPASLSVREHVAGCAFGAQWRPP